MQGAWLLARVAEHEGMSALRYWTRFDELAAEHDDLPLVQGVVFEASYRDTAARAIERLARARAECIGLGLTGVAHALSWRTLSRWLEIPVRRRPRPRWHVCAICSSTCHWD